MIFEINEGLLNATKLALKLALPDKQLLIMCDASEHAAGYVLLIEDYSEQSGRLKKYAPVAFGSKKFQGGQMSLTMYAKEFLAMHFAFDEFGHILWGAKKPIIVMRDNKALTRFFHSQVKHIPPSLWNYCDQTLQFNFILAHVPGVDYPAADYLSKLEIRPEERVHLKLTVSIPVHHKEIDIASETPKQEKDEPDYFPPSEPLRKKKSHDAKPMKVTNSETVARDDGKPMKTLDVTTTISGDDNTMNWVNPTQQASEDDNTSCPQTYRLMTDAHSLVYSKFTVKTSLLASVTTEVSPPG